MDKFIKIGKELVVVTDELYKEFYKKARRQRYMEHDIKVGRINVDMENEKVIFVESKEDSLERLMEQGQDFADGQSVEDIAVDRAMLKILNAAMNELDSEERELVQARYFSQKTFRDIAAKKGISHVAVQKRHEKIISKLKKYFQI